MNETKGEQIYWGGGVRQEAADGDLRPGWRLHHCITAPAPVTAAVCCLSNAGAGPGVIKQSVTSRQQTQHPVSTWSDIWSILIS